MNEYQRHPRSLKLKGICGIFVSPAIVLDYLHLKICTKRVKFCLKV